MRSGLNEALPALPEPGTELLRVSLGARLRCFLIERLLRKRLRAVEAQRLPLLACFPLDSIGREIVSDGFYERELLAALFDGLLASHARRFAAMAAIDVGANIGNHSCFFAPRFRQVVSFEVNPTAAKLLEANAMFNGYGNVSVRNVGLGDEPASLVFEEFKRGNLGRSRFVDAAPAGLGARRLPVERYDDLEEGLGLEAPVALVKVDVEGFEFRVLRGMRRMLERDRPFVMFESHTAGGEHGGRALFELLRAMGYRRFLGVQPVGPSGVPSRARLRDALGGRRWTVAEIAEPEDRFYPLIVAQPVSPAPPS